MKLHVISDLHMEFSHHVPPVVADEVDAIVLAGDTWKGDQGIYWARAAWPDKVILYVPGNHEFYGKHRANVLSMCRIAAKETGVHFLDNAEIVINGVRFLGATLWTDFLLYGWEMQTECMSQALHGLTDFRVIHEGPAHFSPTHALRLNQESVAWLERKLKHEPHDGATVVITHHAPSWQSVVPRFQKDLLSACFASRLEHLLGYSELWVHGHMHDSLDYQVAGTRVLCNPRGYCIHGKACENLRFVPGLIVEVATSRRAA